MLRVCRGVVTGGGQAAGMFKKRIYRDGCCEWCGQEGPQQRKVPNHFTHAVLAGLTLGLWGVSWLSMSILLRGERWRCGHCGAPQGMSAERPGELEHEPTRERAGDMEPTNSVIRTDRWRKVA